MTAVMENLVKKATMVELDEDIAAVWQAIMGDDGEWLADRISHFHAEKKERLIGRDLSWLKIAPKQDLHRPLLGLTFPSSVSGLPHTERVARSVGMTPIPSQ